MYPHSHPQHPGSQPQQRVTNRVPQFNKDYCGYHCGEGCEPYDVGNAASDTSSTLVTENGSQAVERSTPAYDHSEASFLPASYTANEASIEPDGGHLQRNDSMSTRGGSFSSPHSTQYYDEALESPSNFVPSGTRSARSFGSRSAGAVSPSAFQGIGTWVPADGYLPDVNHGNGRFPPEYYFLETPLRLSPHDEHCGGRLESPC